MCIIFIVDCRQLLFFPSSLSIGTVRIIVPEISSPHGTIFFSVCPCATRPRLHVVSPPPVPLLMLLLNCTGPSLDPAPPLGACLPSILRIRINRLESKGRADPTQRRTNSQEWSRLEWRGDCGVGPEVGVAETEFAFRLSLVGLRSGWVLLCFCHYACGRRYSDVRDE